RESRTKDVRRSIEPVIKFDREKGPTLAQLLSPAKPVRAVTVEPEKLARGAHIFDCLKLVFPEGGGRKRAWLCREAKGSGIASLCTEDRLYDMAGMGSRKGDVLVADWGKTPDELLAG